MFQPEPLQTEKDVPWAWGAGNDVWAMFQTAMNGDTSELGRLLERNPGLVRCSWGYRNPLHFAVRENQIAAAGLLLAAGSAITYTGERWHTSAPQIARDRGSDDMAKLIADHQFERFQICPAGDEFATAIQNRDQSGVKTLLSQYGADVADVRGNKPLHWAVMTRQLPVIDLCLAAGGDINAARPDGARPLDLTNGDYWYRGWHRTPPDVLRNHWAVAGYLLARGAEYDLTTACRLGDFDRVRTIVSADPDAANRDALYSTWYSGFPLRSAAKAGHLRIVQYLLDHGADPNRPEHGLAPAGGAVFDATQNGHREIVELLLECGADPNQVVESSGSAVSVAQDERLRSLLRDRGALYDPFGCVYEGHVDDFRTHCERSPQQARDSELFAMAAEQGHREMVEVFLQHDSDIWRRMPARLGKNDETTQWMIDSGMNVNQVNWLDEHSLHGDFKVETLSRWGQIGVDLNLIDSEHLSTPLGLAARRGNAGQVRALLDAGADPNAAGADFARPLEWARRRGSDEIAEMLQ